jgi:hypothetical protein
VPRLTFADLVDKGDAGHTEVFPGVRVARTGRWRIEAPTECERQLNALRDCFTADWGAGNDPGYAATAVTLTRRNDVFIGIPNGICVTADGILIDETAQVARQVDPSLADAPFISLLDNSFISGAYVAVTEPVLHCFHRASGAYGHFLFDALPMIGLSAGNPHGAGKGVDAGLSKLGLFHNSGIRHTSQADRIHQERNDTVQGRADFGHTDIAEYLFAQSRILQVARKGPRS